MPSEKAIALVIRGTDWSETSRIVTLWTREHGKLRAVAKGGRRLRSSFENALDLLTVCSIVFIRKSPDALNLLTEARVERRFPALTRNLGALYGGYYVAELLSDWTEDFDPHPELFDLAVRALLRLESEPSEVAEAVLCFELPLLRILGHGPAFEHCVSCGGSLLAEKDEAVARDGAHAHKDRLTFSVELGGGICSKCRTGCADRRWVSASAYHWMHAAQRSTETTLPVVKPALRVELRQVVSQYVTHWLGRRPRVLRYLEQGS